jgi:hypothetical protein
LAGRQVRLDFADLLPAANPHKHNRPGVLAGAVDVLTDGLVLAAA